MPFVPNLRIIFRERSLSSMFRWRPWVRHFNCAPGNCCDQFRLAKRVRIPGWRKNWDVEMRRAVGRANGENMMCIIIPCHRVIRADGSLCGYGGGLWRKKWLLDHERRFVKK